MLSYIHVHSLKVQHHNKLTALNFFEYLKLVSFNLIPHNSSLGLSYLRESLKIIAYLNKTDCICSKLYHWGHCYFRLIYFENRRIIKIFQVFCFSLLSAVCCQVKGHLTRKWIVSTPIEECCKFWVLSKLTTFNLSSLYYILHDKE